MTTQLYAHQQIAIDTVVNEKFASGVIQYATGSGKSIIGFNIVNKYHELHPDKYVFWICEHKFILKEHFSNNKHINNSMIINYSDDIKPTDWPSLVNQTKIWRKPALVVVNRAFLTMNKKYELLKIPIGLVIHDECHSISSETTREFYAWLPADCKKIGLSATPLYCYEPFTRKICEFTIVDAIKNYIVAKPLIVCAKSEQQITMEDKLGIIHNYLHEHSVHKKMIIWCGTIKHTNEILELWRRLYSNEFACYISHSGIKNNDDVLFNEADNNAILFCACGHHEASDFRNLDGCALLDGVKIRTDKLFVQCLGRVIRKAPNKIYGWILDFDAKNTKQLCDMLMSFVTKSNWRFVQTTHNKDHIQLHCISIELDADIIQKPLSNELCMQHFIRPCPNTANYMQRLHQEMTMINRKNLANYLLKAVQIRDLCQDRIFITRGSCGSSLVCYLLGLTHVDPVKYNVNFARFLHEGRSGLPDIDFDFAYNIRDDVFVKINTHFDNVARISCDVKWCERSATREAIRRIGFNKQMDNRELSILLRSLSNYQKTMVEQIKKSLIGQKRTTMLHVGGIIFDQTTNLNDNKKGLMNISNETKQSLGEKHIFKVDILSSRGLAVLRSVYPSYINNNFVDFVPCEKTFELLASGDNIGLILAESVLMKRAFLKYRPRDIESIARCLAIVRPLAKMSREYIDKDQTVVYDDDVIDYIKTIMDCDDSVADNIRRQIAKNDVMALQAFLSQLKYKVPREEIMFHIKLISRITEYGFCKAHALSYAMLVYQLAYAKVHEPLRFWKGAIEHADSSYAPWVHMIEAVLNGVNLKDESLMRNNMSIYSQVRQRHNIEHIKSLCEKQQLAQYGYWLSLLDGEYFPGCYMNELTGGIYKFRGIVAAFRTPNTLIKQNKMGFYLGVGPHKYLDIVMPNIHYNKGIVIIEGYCKYSNEIEGIMEGFKCKGI